jgi:CHAD domain-containing protein
MIWFNIHCMEKVDVFKNLRKILENEMKLYSRLIKVTRHNPSNVNVHSMRVQIQRLSATLWITRLLVGQDSSRKLINQLGILKKLSSPLRDLQVEIVSLKAKSAYQQLLRLKKNLVRNESKLRKEMRRELQKISLNKQKKFVARIDESLSLASRGQRKSGASGSIENLILKELREFRKADLSKMNGHAKRLHGLRLKAKFIRYLGEAQQAVTGKTNINLRRFHQAQDVLGEIQNDRAFLRNVDVFLKRKSLHKNKDVKAFRFQLLTDQRRRIEAANKLLGGLL